MTSCCQVRGQRVLVELMQCAGDRAERERSVTRNKSLIISVFVGALALLCGPSNPSYGAKPKSPTPAQQKEIKDLTSELANIRTTISSLDSVYREALTSVAEAIDRIDRGFFIAKQPGNALTLVGLLHPVSRMFSLAVKVPVKIAQAYDAVVASVNAGKLTTTRKELIKLKREIDNSRLDSIAPWLNKQRKVIDRLKKLGVANQ